VKLEDYFEDKEFFFLCLELLSKNTLKDYVSLHDNHLEEIQVKSIAVKIGEAVKFLHEHGIILRNLESTGILMSESSKYTDLKDVLPRIARFDKAEVKGYGEFSYGIFGDLRYRAPEVIAGRGYT